MSQALQSARLRLAPADPALAGRVAAFFARNAAHLAPWEPRRTQLADALAQRLSLEQMAQAFADGTGWRWLLLPLDDETRVIGSVAVNNVVRGFHHSANLGYAIDAQAQGQGLMREALQTVIQHVFAPAVNLHRLQAAVRPENARSLALLNRLGFGRIGLARDYLCIAGRWCDHELFEQLNPAFRAPVDWV